MKAITAVCPTGAAVVNGRVSRRTASSNNGENAEIKMYLSKLKDLVPFMPKNRKLSKLEIIQHVIDYICDLQSELETSPSIGVSNFDATAVLNELQQQDDRILTSDNSNNSNTSLTSSSSSSLIPNNGIINSSHQHIIRQPLVDRSTPNMILTSSPPTSAINSSSGVHYQQHQHSLYQHSHTTTDKINFDGNSRS